MKMRQSTPSQPPVDTPVTPQGYNTDPEVSLNHDDLFAKAWEFDFEQPIFDAENNNAASPNPQEIPVQSNF